MSTSYNNIKRSVAPKSLFESAKEMISTSSSWNQGDLIVVTGGILNAVTGAGQSALVAGVARQKVASGKVVSPNQGTAVDAAQALEDLAGPVYGVIAELTIKTSDALAKGALVYLEGSDPQLVTVSTAANAVGIYQGPTITGAAGQKVEILVGATYNLPGLQF